jgi:DNA-binding XRE family transcriptional regulator
MDIPTPAQTRAARAMLNMSREDLARLSGVSKRAIANFEAEATQLMRLNHQAVRQTLERAGVEFDDRGGVRLRSADKSGKEAYRKSK